MSKMPNIRLTSVEDLFKTDEERQTDKLEKVQIVPAERVHPYPREPYQVDRATADLVQLMDSIQRVGIAEPMIVRPRTEGGYEIIAGHRRDYCARKLGLPDRPVIVREYDDATADVLISDYNIRREDLLPSERARAYALWMDGMRRQGQRSTSLQIEEKLEQGSASTSLQNEEKLVGKLSVELLAEQVQENVSTVQRYIRLTHLIPVLLDRVDEKKLGFIPAADYLHKLTEKEQVMLEMVMAQEQVSPSVDQAQQLKRLSEAGELTEAVLRQIMAKKAKEKKVVLKETSLGEYFPQDYTPKQMEDVILHLLKDWSAKQGIPKDET
mgnify:FL=1